MFSSQFAKLNVQNRPFPSSSKDALVILQDCDIYNMPSLINYCRTAEEIESLSANVLKAKEKEEASRMRATKQLEDFGRVMNDQHEAETAAIAAKMDEMALPQKSEKGPEAPRAKMQKISEEDTDFGDTEDKAAAALDFIDKLTLDTVNDASECAEEMELMKLREVIFNLQKRLEIVEGQLNRRNAKIEVLSEKLIEAGVDPAVPEFESQMF